MATNLAVYGPFNVSYEASGRAKRIRTDHVSAFWANSATKSFGVKQGCYVFSLRAAKGFKPWYVGKATKSFEQEVFTDHNRNIYNDVLFVGRKGTPVIFLVAPQGTKCKVPAKEIAHMEKELIQYGVKRNPDLYNVQHTKNLPQWTIKGVVRSPQGKPPRPAVAFKTMMRI